MVDFQPAMLVVYLHVGRSSCSCASSRELEISSIFKPLKEPAFFSPSPKKVTNLQNCQGPNEIYMGISTTNLGGIRRNKSSCFDTEIYLLNCEFHDLYAERKNWKIPTKQTVNQPVPNGQNRMEKLRMKQIEIQ